MANIESIKTSIKKEEDGVWVDFIMGIELKIARSRNPKYQELLRKLVEPQRKDIRDDKLTIDELADIVLQVRAKTVLLDWKNIEDSDGKAIPYSPEKAAEFFRDPELNDFYTFVVAISENADQYKKDIIKDSEKNL